MALIRFTENLQRHIHSPDCHAASDTLRKVLKQVFEQHLAFAATSLTIKVAQENTRSICRPPPAQGQGRAQSID